MSSYFLRLRESHIPVFSARPSPVTESCEYRVARGDPYLVLGDISRSLIQRVRHNHWNHQKLANFLLLPQLVHKDNTLKPEQSKGTMRSITVFLMALAVSISAQNVSAQKLLDMVLPIVKDVKDAVDGKIAPKAPVAAPVAAPVSVPVPVKGPIRSVAKNVVDKIVKVGSDAVNPVLIDSSPPSTILSDAPSTIVSDAPSDIISAAPSDTPSDLPSLAP